MFRASLALHPARRLFQARDDDDGGDNDRSALSGVRDTVVVPPPFDRGNELRCQGESESWLLLGGWGLGWR